MSMMGISILIDKYNLLVSDKVSEIVSSGDMMKI